MGRSTHASVSMAYPPHSRTLSLAVFLLLFPFSRVCPLTVLCRSLLFCSYLGDRRSFQRDVARPVRAALSSEGDGRATVEGLAELEKLHKQARMSTAFVNDVFFPFCSSFDTMHDLFISVSSLRLYGSVLLAFLLVWRQCLGASHFIQNPPCRGPRIKLNRCCRSSCEEKNVRFLPTSPPRLSPRSCAISPPSNGDCTRRGSEEV